MADLLAPLREFNDSQLGVVLGSVLHTLGAIAFLGGLVAYLSWHRHLARDRYHNRAVLELATVLTYLAIVVNLAGGFMRTFQSGHPHLTQWAESPWVRAIAIKHVFLFAAMGAAVYLLEAVAPRLRRAHKDGTLGDAYPTGHRVGVLLASLGILVAAVLGALTQVVPLVSAEAGMEDGHDHGAMETVTYHNATGQLTSTPLSPATSTGSFAVPNGTVQLQATLLWSPAQSQLRLVLRSPSGQEVPLEPTGQGQAGGSLAAPETGPWSYTIASDLAVNVAWQLSLRFAAVEGEESLMAATITIPPGQFFEINTEMEQGASFWWAWSASAVVHFNVHSHFDGQVQDHVDEDASEGQGSFTNQRAGGYSLLWDNTGNLPVTLTYRVWGDFELDSTFPPS